MIARAGEWRVVADCALRGGCNHESLSLRSERSCARAARKNGRPVRRHVGHQSQLHRPWPPSPCARKDSPRPLPLPPPSSVGRPSRLDVPRARPVPGSKCVTAPQGKIRPLARRRTASQSTLVTPRGARACRRRARAARRERPGGSARIPAGAHDQVDRPGCDASSPTSSMNVVPRAGSRGRAALAGDRRTDFQPGHPHPRAVARRRSSPGARSRPRRGRDASARSGARACA